MFTIEPIPSFTDNYIWMLRNDSYVAFIDPGEAHSVLEKIQMFDLIPTAIMITHHHHDHTGGVQQILHQYPDLPVYGPANEPIKYITQPMNENDVVKLEKLNARFTVLDTPGHTRGHIAYYGMDSLFCGDTLFSCGCGRLFEGTKEQMDESLRKILRLPERTLIYCAHEYTLDNIGFAKWVEPNNADLIQRETEVIAKRSRGMPTVPSTLAIERRTNPFLRCSVKEVIHRAELYAGHTLTTTAEVFGVLREWKDKEYD